MKTTKQIADYLIGRTDKDVFNEVFDNTDFLNKKWFSEEEIRKAISNNTVSTELDADSYSTNIIVVDDLLDELFGDENE